MSRYHGTTVPNLTVITPSPSGKDQPGFACAAPDQQLALYYALMTPTQAFIYTMEPLGPETPDLMEIGGFLCADGYRVLSCRDVSEDPDFF